MQVTDDTSPPALTELFERKQWLTWSYQERGGKRTKVPRGMVNDPATWTSHSDAAATATKRGGGVGFVFTAEDPFVGMDLDGCVHDGVVHPAAQDLIDKLGSFWEISPSGTGVHVIAQGELPEGFGNRGRGAWGGNVEVYDRGRFFTMTGTGTGQVRECTRELADVAQRYLSPAVPAVTDFDWDHEPADGFAGTDDELLAHLREHDPRFGDIFDGWTIPAGKDNGDSDQDFALCARLATLTGDHPRRIERLWSRSKLAERDKWQREDYRQSTIARAIASADEERNGDAAYIEFGCRRVASLETEGSSSGCHKDTPAASTSQEDPPVQVGNSDPASPPRIGRTALELRNSPRGATDWLIPGVAARGWTVLIAGREKISGKGTVSAYLIGRLERREDTVFGVAAKDPVTALVLTEEPEDALSEKYESFDVRRATVVYDWELSKMPWRERIDWLVATALERGHGLVYVDNVSRAAGVSSDDESGTGLARKIEPLSSAARQHGLTVLLDHHTRKAGGKTEDLLRGGTALPGAVENIITIERDGDWTSRRRKLYSRGRVKATLWKRTLELTEDGTDYVEVTGDFRRAALASKDEWTAAEFGAAIGKSADVARRYLNESEHVGRVDTAHGGRGGGSTAAAYRVKDRPALLAALAAEDPNGEGPRL